MGVQWIIDIYYHLGVAYYLGGEIEKAMDYFKTATYGISEPTVMMFYNHQPADIIMYQGLAHMKLGEMNEAEVKFKN